MTHHGKRGLLSVAAVTTDPRFSALSVNGKIGKGIKTLAGFVRGDLVAHFTGRLGNTVLQHTLQVSPDLHLHDPNFLGLLTHSCAPNCVLDMQRLEIRALTEIVPGVLLTIDYAVTEDRLFRQFPCRCGSPVCRGWISGRREPIDAEGRAFLAQRKPAVSCR